MKQITMLFSEEFDNWEKIPSGKKVIVTKLEENALKEMVNDDEKHKALLEIAQDMLKTLLDEVYPKSKAKRKNSFLRRI